MQANIQQITELANQRILLELPVCSPTINQSNQMKLTEPQIQWASQHDWFVRRSGNQIVVIGEQGEMVWNRGFQALRDWAGY